jgi:hypothetical protein
MSHIQLFFQQHLPAYYLQVAQSRLTAPDFLTPNSKDSIFTLTTELIVSSQKCQPPGSAPATGQSMAREWLMSYDNLRHAAMPIEEGDNEIVRFLKSKLEYVLQSLLRLTSKCSRLSSDSSSASRKVTLSRNPPALPSNTSKKSA